MPATESHPVPRLLRQPAFVRLWAVGALANAMRWVETLVAAVFTYEVTQSVLAVSLVAMLRAVPMLLMGATTGALAELMDRRRLLMLGQALTMAGALTVLALASLGLLQVWHLAVHGLLGGLVWTGEMATRRRMLTEVAGEADSVPAVALDSMTNNTTRMIGPLLGGAIYQLLGLPAAYVLSACCYLLAFSLVAGVRHAQVPQRIAPRLIAAGVVDAVRVTRRHPTLLTVILVTIINNVFGFCFIAVLPALGTSRFGADAIGIGLLTAAEPAGALLMGLFLAGRRGAPLTGHAMLGGAAFFLACLLALSLAPSLWLAVLALVVGGLGTALFAALQTALVVVRAPADARSRVLGLVTTCIGMGPAGQLAIGAIADSYGPGIAIPAMAGLGLALLALSWLTVTRKEEPWR